MLYMNDLIIFVCREIEQMSLLTQSFRTWTHSDNHMVWCLKLTLELLRSARAR